MRATCRLLLVDRPTKAQRLGQEEDPNAALRKALVKARRESVSIANTVLRALWRTDGAALDAWIREHPGATPRGRDLQWPTSMKREQNPEQHMDGYQLARSIAPELSSGIAAYVARLAQEKWQTTRWDALVKQSCSPPHYRETMPVPVRAQQIGLEPHPRGLKLSFPLVTGRGNRYERVIEARDAWTREVLSHLGDGSWELGALQIEEDRLRWGRWYVRLSYKRLIPKQQAQRYAAVHRGLKNFLVCVVDTGARWVYSCDDIEATLKAFQSQRRRYQYQSKASNRWGHGRKRTLKPIERLQGKGERWRASKNQTIARQLSRWLDAQGVGVVFVEDFSGIRNGEPERLEVAKSSVGQAQLVWQRVQEWPYHDVQMRLSACEAERGATTVVLLPHYNAQRCPECGHVDEQNRDLKRWKIACTSCGHKENLDVASARNVLARGLEKLHANGSEEKPPRAKKPARPARGRRR